MLLSHPNPTTEPGGGAALLTSQPTQGAYPRFSPLSAADSRQTTRPETAANPGRHDMRYGEHGQTLPNFPLSSTNPMLGDRRTIGFHDTHSPHPMQDKMMDSPNIARPLTTWPPPLPDNTTVDAAPGNQHAFFSSTFHPGQPQPFSSFDPHVPFHAAPSPPLTQVDLRVGSPTWTAPGALPNPAESFPSPTASTGAASASLLHQGFGIPAGYYPRVPISATGTRPTPPPNLTPEILPPLSSGTTLPESTLQYGGHISRDRSRQSQRYVSVQDISL